MATRFARSPRPVPASRPDLGESRGRALLIVAALAAVIVAGALGWLLGGALHGDRAAPPAASDRLATVGSLRLLVDGDWVPAPAGKELAATRLSDLSAFAPVPGLPGRTWIARAAADGPALVPQALRARVASVPTPEKVTLAGRPAWRYPAMELRSGGLLEVTALPTMAGVLLVGCEAGKTAWSTVVGCGRAVRAVGGAAALAPGADLAFRQHLAAVVTKLNAARAGAGRALKRARHARGQRAAATRLAAAHATAAARLSPLAPATGPARKAVVRLTASAQAYRALAQAAASGSRRRYGKARKATRRADHALTAALAGAGRS
jgi:hypothetical protein